MALTIKSADKAQFDALALGEVMLRLDPGEMRIRSARSFLAWEGGGEYNVIRGLRKCFGLRTAIATALVDNEIGRLVEELIMQGGVDTRYINWIPFDGIGRTARNGLNFTERGFGIRAPLGVSDRGHSATSQLSRGAFPWSEIFGKVGIRWFHTGGIFAALSETTAPTLIEAAKAARAAGTIVSFDFNYRPSLWKALPPEVNVKNTYTNILQNVDVVIGGEADLTRVLDYKGSGKAHSAEDRFKESADWMLAHFPNISLVTAAIREQSEGGQQHSLTGLAQSRTGTTACAPLRNINCLDRIGSGDSFASGLFYGLLADRSLEESLRLGIAHAALALTTPGDNSMMTKVEVEELANAGALKLSR